MQNSLKTVGIRELYQVPGSEHVCPCTKGRGRDMYPIFFIHAVKENVQMPGFWSIERDV